MQLCSQYAIAFDEFMRLFASKPEEAIVLDAEEMKKAQEKQRNVIYVELNGQRTSDDIFCALDCLYGNYMHKHRTKQIEEIHHGPVVGQDQWMCWIVLKGADVRL